MNTKENIYLVGLMGSGKTTVGRQLARRLGRDFFDSDHEIEAKTGVRVATIFEIEGEEGFRRREVQVISELVTYPGIVLATGGGAVLNPANRSILKETGWVVYLNVEPRLLWNRVHHDKSRPLLQVENPLARLEALYAARDPLYRECADLIVDGGRLTPNIITQQLVKELARRCKL